MSEFDKSTFEDLSNGTHETIGTIYFRCNKILQALEVDTPANRQEATNRINELCESKNLEVSAYPIATPATIAIPPANGQGHVTGPASRSRGQI